MTQVIDTPTNVGDYGEALARAGVRCVIRYYNHRNVTLPEKRLVMEEAEKLTEAGLSLGVVFQQRGGAGGHIKDFDPADARRDADRALELAEALNQPTGSAIYFAVDHDFVKRSDQRKIRAYFQSIQGIFDGRFRLGAYGSGHTLAHLRDHKLTDLSWLSQSKGWTGYHSFLASHDWALAQGPMAQWPNAGFAYDTNLVNPGFVDFGQFNLATPAASPVVTAPTRAIYQVMARSGLNMRRGPSESYSVIQTLPKDTIVQGTALTGDWVQVDINGDGYADGYMFAGYLKLLAGGLDAPTIGHTTPYGYAKQELARNIAEVPGAGNNPRILLYHASTSKGAPDATPWCSSFVNWCVTQAGLEGTNSKWAMSWHTAKWGDEVTADPKEGDVAVYERRWPKSDGTIGIGGHVGFVARANGHTISLLGGNQNNRVSVRAYPRTSGTIGQQSYKLLSIRRPDALSAEALL